MTRLELCRWLTRVSIEASAIEKRALILQYLTPLMMTPADPNDSTTDRSDPRGRHEFKVNDITVKSAIKDHSMVKRAWQEAYHDRLKIEPCRTDNEDGAVADGFVALMNERPLLSIVAIDDDLIELQVGGFDKKILAHPGNLMDLSRQVTKQDKSNQPRANENVKDISSDNGGSTFLGIPIPKFVVRATRAVSVLGGFRSDDPPILYPHRLAKDDSGRDQHSPLVAGIMGRLGVYVLVAYRMLEADGATPKKALDIIEEAYPARTFDYLRRIGQQRLQDETCFNTEEQLKQWAKSPTSVFRLPGLESTATRELRSAAVLEPLRLLSTALTRAENTLHAVHATQLASDQELEGRLVEAFGRAGAAFDAWDCYRVAKFGDFNPAACWRNYARYALAFEFGRFVGRVDRGAKAVLTSTHFDWILDLLAGVPADDPVISRINVDIRTCLDIHFGAARFQNMVDRTRSKRGVLVVERGSRIVRCRTDAGLRARIFSRA